MFAKLKKESMIKLAQFFPFYFLIFALLFLLEMCEFFFSNMFVFRREKKLFFFGLKVFLLFLIKICE